MVYSLKILCSLETEMGNNKAIVFLCVLTSNASTDDNACAVTKIP